MTSPSRSGVLRAAARVARADLAGRPVQTALTALAIFAAATALVVTLALRNGLDDPFAAAQRETKGSHVSVYGEGGLAPLAQLPGVVASDLRPHTDVFTTLAGRAVDVGVEALPAPSAAVDVPHLTDGRRPGPGGEIVIFPRATLPAGTEIGETDVIARFASGTDGAALARDLERQALAAELVSEEVRQERADVRPIVYGSSALLVAVGREPAHDLLLVTRERARDFGILKAIGLTPRGVLGVVTSGGAAVGLIAIVLGIPIGIVLFRSLMTAMSESEGADIVGTPGPFALALIVPFVLLVTALASSFPARGAARSSAAAILRAE